MLPRCREHLLLVVPVTLLVLGFHALPTAGVDFRDVALAAAASIPELDMNAVARGMGQITCVRSIGWMILIDWGRASST